MAARCFLQIRGRWYAVMNRQARNAPADAVVLRPMTLHEVEAYQTMKRGGFLEAAIFAQLYPPQTALPVVREVVLPVTMLTKTQLSYLIENKLGAALPSLQKMHKDDLVCLLGQL